LDVPFFEKKTSAKLLKVIFTCPCLENEGKKYRWLSHQEVGNNLTSYCDGKWRMAKRLRIIKKKPSITLRASAFT
jgi:hypothetical protein